MYSASRLRRFAFIVLLPMTIGGCGIMFVHGPPAGHRQMDYFTCTESQAGPIIDLVWGSLNFVVAAVVAVDPEAYEDTGIHAAYNLSWAVMSGVAAGVGFHKTRKCKEAKRALALRQIAERARMERTYVRDAAVVREVVIRPAVDTLTVGDRIQLVATAMNSSGHVVSDKMFRWSSSHDAIASVSNAGLVTAHAVGAVVIAANTDNIVGTAGIVVVPQH
jgi:hypothetical protein